MTVIGQWGNGKIIVNGKYIIFTKIAFLDLKAHSRNMRDKCEQVEKCQVNTYPYDFFMNIYISEFCKTRQKLVERTLLDLQASHTFSQLWEKEWERNKKYSSKKFLNKKPLISITRNGVHLAFFVAQSGVLRFRNQSLQDRYFYEQQERQTNESNP
jgi:hypothetical protein